MADAVPAEHAGPSVVIFASEIVRVGRFRCPIGHPLFNDSGPTRDYCFVFPRTSVWIEHEGTRPFVADANVIPFYNPASPYLRRAISSLGDRTDWFGIAPDLLRDALMAHDPVATTDSDRLFRFASGPATPHSYLWQRTVYEYVEAHERPDCLLVEESVVSLLAQVLRDTYRTAPPLRRHRHHHDIVEDARAHLSTTFARSERLSEIARAVGVSVYHLCRLFKQASGSTLHHHRNQLRLKHSLGLLRDCDDILAVALALGYSGHSHFTRTFRRAFGISPSEWRTRSARVAFG
jgi:AraC family transcriptional regulator